MGKSDELVKFLTQRIVTYIDNPKEVRRQLRTEKKPQEPWHVKWFGMLPMALGMWTSNVRVRVKKFPLYRGK